MARLRLALLGGFRLARNGAEIEIPTRKGQALLAYLATAPGRAATRATLAALLWGDRFDEQARRSLRQCLFELRRALGDDDARLLAADGDVVTLSDDVECDVGQFEAAAGGADGAALERALDLHAGDLLAGFDLREEAFNDWLRQSRDRLRALHGDALSRATLRARERGDAEAAIRLAQRLVMADPLREQGHRLLMRLYAENGRRSEALRQYQACAAILRETLDVDPEAETTALCQAIRDGGGPPPAPAAAVAPAVDAVTAVAPRRRRGAWLTWPAAATASAALAAAAWLWIAPPERAPQDAPDAPQSEFPVIVVQPFDGAGGTPDEAILARTLTADLSAWLSRFAHLVVVVPAGDAAPAPDYALHGTVLKTAGPTRVSVQLRRNPAGRLVWAESYERDAANALDGLAEISRAIAAAAGVNIWQDQTRELRGKNPERLTQQQLLYSARERLFLVTPEGNRAARDLYERAIQIDPHNGQAHAYLAWALLNEWRLGWSDDPQASLLPAFAAAQEAVRRAPHLVDGHEALGDVYLWLKRHDLAEDALRRALRLNASEATAHAILGDILGWAGRPDEAAAAVEEAMRLDPLYPYTYGWYLAHAQFLRGDLDAAERTLLRVRDQNPNFIAAYMYLAAIAAARDRPDEAKAALERAVAINPRLSRAALQLYLPYRNPADLERLLALLDRAGLPPFPAGSASR
jgi:DNA-binding SARP family transcriptional activator/TolB-like protein/Tfp pilus assembly protein PilF